MTPLLGRPRPPGHRWTVELSVRAFPHLADHRLQGVVVLPGSAYLEMAMAAVSSVTGTTPCVVADVNFERAFVVAEEEPRALRTTLSRGGDTGWWEFLATDVAGVRHAAARLGGPAGETNGPSAWLRPEDPRWRRGREVDGADLYARLSAAGNDFGPAFRGVRTCLVGDHAALGVLREPDGERHWSADFDHAMQVLTSTLPDSDHTFALVGCERLRLLDNPAPAHLVYARLRPETGPGADLVGDVLVVDRAGRPTSELTGVTLRPIPLPRKDSSRERIAVAATFTADLLADSLSFWFDTLGIPAAVELAGYGQTFQQLLDPGSLLSTNTDGVNVLLVRPEDLSRSVASVPGSTAPLADRPRFALPGVGDIAHLVPYETEYLYDEIFVRRAYLRHGIELRPGDRVFDVGANIGMFTLFVHQQCPTAEIYAFEPAPAAYDVLRRNTAVHCPSATLFDVGLAEEDAERSFTFYPHSTVFSGFDADAAADRVAVETVVRNALRTSMSVEAPGFGALVDHFTAGRLDARTHRRRTRRLSDVLTELAVPRVDLLKIDVEGGEAGVLAGIDDEHWSVVRQVVVETHDQETRTRVCELLTRHGFDVVVDDADESLAGTGFAYVFARRAGEPEARPAGLEQVTDELVEAIAAARDRGGVPYVVVLCPPTAEDPVAVRARRRFVAGLAGLPGVVVITPEEIQRTYPVADYHDPTAERLGGIPYTERYFAALGTMVARRVAAVRHPPAKVLALDCDQTLWAGVCGEDGPHGVVIDPPRRALQEFAVAQHDAGMLVCLCSKNNEDDVLGVLTHRTDLPLSVGHLAAWRVNWAAKSTNLAALADELGLSLADFVFLDDDPVECAEVMANRPEVLTLRLPADAERIPLLLQHIWAVDRIHVTDDDRARASRYGQERQRRAVRESMTFESFLANLQLCVEITRCAASDVLRVAQLTQRTSQFNTAGRAYPEALLRGRLAAGDLDCLVVRVHDRFGDYGLVGAMLFDQHAGALRVDTWVLSCRALGRGVEHRMLAGLGELAERRGLDRVVVRLRPSGRNEPARAFLASVAERSLPDGDGVLHTLPAGAAARTVYEPAREPDPPPVPRPAAVSTRPPASVYRRIAEELHEVDAIVAAVGRWRRRRRPARTTYAGPGDEVERDLVALWRRVLGVDEVGIDDNFFDLGGTSLRSVQVIAELSDRTGGVMPVTSLFERPTVRAMAAVIRGGGDEPDQLGRAGHDRGRRRRGLVVRRMRGHDDT